MDGAFIDNLARLAAGATSRRASLALLANSALAGALASFELTGARKKRKNKRKKRCKKPFQDCGGKKKCCKGLSCIDGSCGCPTGTVPSAGKCINPEPPECADDNDCGANETCQNGACVPDPEPECDNDDDCTGNEVCQGGFCVCLESVIGGECVVTCNTSSDCPGDCNSCRGVFPGDGDRIVCVDEPFLLCDDAIACDQVDECPSGFICASTTCDSPAGSGRCFPISCNV